MRHHGAVHGSHKGIDEQPFAQRFFLVKSQQVLPCNHIVHWLRCAIMATACTSHQRDATEKESK